MNLRSGFMILWVTFFPITPVLSNPAEKDFDFILGGNYDTGPAKANSNYTDPVISEIGLTARALIRIYQTTISSQDSPACNFHPSCSRFTMEAIQKKGFIRGTLLGADRLMRCHWFSKKLYSKYYGWDFEHEPYQLHDPVERYYNLNKYE